MFELAGRAGIVPDMFPMTPPSTLKSDTTLRVTLLDYYVKHSTNQELSDWLRQLGQDLKGTVEEKRARVCENTKYLSMSPETFPEQTLSYLSVYSSDHLSGICEAISIDPEGGKDLKWRRVMREVGFREGWLPRLGSLTERSFNLQLVRPFVEWHLIAKRGSYEKDFYPGFFDDMEEVFGHAFVHAQLPIAFGTTLKIDFHIGHPQRGGVGIEFKMPANNSELQRALGQMDQYQAQYKDQLLVVLFPDFLDKSLATFFVEKLTEKNIHVIIK